MAFFNWLKRFLGITPPPSPPVGGSGESPYTGLDERKKDAKESKDRIKSSSTDWYKLDVPKLKEKRLVKVYHVYKFGEILNLKALKEERKKKEAHEQKIFEDKVNTLLDSVDRFIAQRKAEEAKTILGKVLNKIGKVKDEAIRQKYQQIQNYYDQLVVELKQEELVRLAKERRQKEEEEKKRKEAEEIARKKKEEQERKEREKREAEAQRVIDEARKKEQAEQQERQRLMALSSEMKDDWKIILNVLQENGIKYLYHFTDKSNIPSIKRYGGLLSWYYCKTQGIRISRPGGGDVSRQLDESRNLQDYVRLSFTKEHPMKYIAIKDGRIQNPVNLIIDIKAACIKSTLYSNKNATIKREPVNIGSTIDDLKQIHFESVKVQKHFDLDENERSFFQAEIMVKTFLPKEYIINLDKF